MMGLFLINILLAAAWGAVTGSFSPLSLVFGFVLGAAVLYMIREQIGTGGYFVRSWRVFILVWTFIYELVLSAVRVAKIVCTPDLSTLQPGIIAYPLTVDRDFEITLLANLITLTPGTLTVDVSEDRKVLYVHCIDVPDPEATITDIREAFERKILEAFR
ncbi:Na+/H+ antiporter subunit E [Breoghania sp. L-A4]|uniref:Na+/H+ antiporter subunit E n=1 Tax=Breoghania sp. L-A4 TaxID=2304600 RepID=UPI000E35FC32|nr:Na+/H+ antiporter subunit E [Breoghania sp. L-A4]AXS39924.1 Na+/H+ antiporter subunit E [Breoghania sp. L-A4]